MSFLKPKGSLAPNRSLNTNNALLTGTYSPAMQQGVGAQNVLAGALGVPGGNVTGANAGFEQFLGNAGFNNALQRLSQGVIGGQAASGLLRSGSTGTRLLEEGTALNQQMFNNYLQNLAGLSGLGLQSGGLVANAGQESYEGAQSKGGQIASLIGGVASIFSDRRLKTDIEKIEELSDGLGIYGFRYRGGLRRFIGVMADEVARLRPWALGPKVAGYATVNYGRL